LRPMAIPDLHAFDEAEGGPQPGHRLTDVRVDQYGTA
jgi:hypothetical protein